MTALPEGVVSVFCNQWGAAMLWVPRWVRRKLPQRKRVNIYYNRESMLGVFHFIRDEDADDWSYHVSQNRIVISGLCRALGLRLHPGCHYFRASHDDDVLIVFFNEPVLLR